MWDDFKGFFETFSYTDPDSPNEKRHPIQSKKPVNVCLQKAERWAKSKEDIEGLIVSEDYNEIYYKLKGCEITAIFLELPTGGTLISAHVLGGWPNKSRKMLYSVLEEIRKAVED